MDTKEIQIKDYNYPLPDERIAKFPLPERDSSKLLVYKSGEVSDDVFRSLPNYLPQGALMVFNNTKVIRARLHFRKGTLFGSPFREREQESLTSIKALPLEGERGEGLQESLTSIKTLPLEGERGEGLQESLTSIKTLPLEGEQGEGLQESLTSIKAFPLEGERGEGLQESLTSIKALPQRGSREGALIEIFLLEPASPAEYQENFIATSECSWYCLIGNSKKWKEGLLYGTFQINGKAYTISAERVAPHGTSFEIRFRWEGDFAFSEVLESLGELPIPPYLNRKTEESDLRTYQTVYSKIKGSVAAPTAGLHFTERVLADLDAHGIEREELTLHVGAGTFKPVKSEEIGDHEMHTEHIAVRLQTIEKLIQHGGKAIAVGTTSVRTLESLYYMGIIAQRLMDEGKDTGEGEELHVPQWMPYETASPLTPLRGEGNLDGNNVQCLKSLRDYMLMHKLDVLHSSTQIIIAPGYKFHIVQMMVTNFHQPQSTLLLLVSAFVHGDWRKIYDYALANQFRFLSYGDSSLLIP